MKTQKPKITFFALAMLSAVSAVIGAPTISNLRLAGGPDSPHFYVSTFNYATYPTNVSVSPGALVYFTVSASGSGISYQWRTNGINLAGEIHATLGYPGRELAPADYTVVVKDSLANSITSRVMTVTMDATFTKINAWNGSFGSLNPIVTDTGWSDCGTWCDYDGDGYLDLFVGNGLDGNPDASALYHNNGDGTFTRVYPSVFDVPIIQSEVACWGDSDNDGKPDLFVLAFDSTATGPNGGFLFYHNEGGGVFSQPPSGIVITNQSTTGAALADYDQDGFLDLFVTTRDSAANSHCFLFRNNGDGTFTAATNNILATDLGSAVGCAWGDYDGDGKIDLFVCGGRGPGSPQAPNRLYHNNGDGTFTRITTGSIVTDLAHSGNAVWVDYDNDGYPDLFVMNIEGEKHFLYHNNGNGTFTKITNPIVAGGPSGWFDIGNQPISCAWGDYDNDGFLDLMTTDEGFTAPFVNFIYHNNGDGTFTKVTTGSPVNEYSDSWTGSWVDFDNDGFLDLFAIRGDQRGNALYHNNLPNTGNTNTWLTVKLVGTVSNRSAIGAKVRAKAFYRGQSRWQLRQIGGGGWAGHDELRANFGFGDATNVDTLRIEWPSGIVQEFHNVSPKQILTITEPPRLMAGMTNGIPQFSFKGGRGFQYEIDSSPDLSSWESNSVATVTNLSGIAPIVDINPSTAARFYRAKQLAP